MKKPDWREWENIPEVKVWEACALSLDIDPHSMKHDRNGWMGGPGSGPFFEDESFLNSTTKDEYALRLRVLLANLSNRDFFSAGTLSLVNPASCGVRLSEFAAWAVSVVKWNDLPPELEAMTQRFADYKAKDEGEFDAAFAESVYNGVSINWRYWVHQMPTLTTAQAARLMSGLDPDIFENLDSRPNKNDPSRLCEKARMIQRLVETQGKHSESPAEWLAWADSHGFKVHDGFRIEVEAMPSNRQADAPASEDIKAGKGLPAANWKLQVQSEAARRWVELKNSGASPTKLNIRDDLVKWCNENNIKTNTGISVSAENLYKFALRPWKPPSDN